MPKKKSEPEATVQVQPSYMRMNISDRMNTWFKEHTCQGLGDIRGPITADAILQVEDSHEWTINRIRMDKSAVMALIVDMLYEFPLTQILRVPGMPKPRTLASWLERHPAFQKAFEDSERMRGILRAEEAMEIADSATEKNSKAKKLQVDVRLRLAEAYNPKKFAKRHIEEKEDALSRLTDKEVEDRFMSFLGSNQQALEDRLGVRILFGEDGRPIGAVERASIIDSLPKAVPVAEESGFDMEVQ